MVGRGMAQASGRRGNSAGSIVGQAGREHDRVRVTVAHVHRQGGAELFATGRRDLTGQR